MRQKIHKNNDLPTNNIILHTGPHHDDILLGYSPVINHLVRSANNTNYFAIMTSGFTSVTNKYISNLLLKTLELIESEKIQMLNYPDFFESGFRLKTAKDVYHYLDKVASQNIFGQVRGLWHRKVRNLVDSDYSKYNLDPTLKGVLVLDVDNQNTDYSTVMEWVADGNTITDNDPN